MIPAAQAVVGADLPSLCSPLLAEHPAPAKTAPTICTCADGMSTVAATDAKTTGNTIVNFIADLPLRARPIDSD